MSEDGSKYFFDDVQYSDALKQRLVAGVEMDSAKAMGRYLQDTCTGNLRILDFGGGPGHYYPVIKRAYTRGAVSYTSADIDETHVQFGRRHFGDDPLASFAVGSVMTPRANLGDHNCIVSANTLPHVPTIAPLLDLLATTPGVLYFVFRMLVGEECVQIKKHLREQDFEGMFERDFQFNNIYSPRYMSQRLGSEWQIRVEPDVFDTQRLQQHRLPEQEINPFYANRVSRPVNGMVFKGDIYMPWKFVIGSRVAKA